MAITLTRFDKPFYQFFKMIGQSNSSNHRDALSSNHKSPIQIAASIEHKRLKTEKTRIWILFEKNMKLK